MAVPHRVSIMWFRRDLRLRDNPALVAAAAAGDRVLPLFVIDPALWGPSGQPRREYLAASLRALSASMGGRLVVRQGDPVELLPRIAEEIGAESVHIASDYGPYGARRDDAVEEALRERGVTLDRLGSPYAVAPGRVRNGSGEGFKVYTPYSRAWAAHGWRAPIDAPEVTWLKADSDGIPDEGGDWDAGEEAAHDRWESFLDRVSAYADKRDLPGVAGTSQMSPHLKWGEIHPRTMLADLSQRTSDGAATYRKELAWREFYADVLWRHPKSARDYYHERFAKMEYDRPGKQLKAWQEGRTGFPIVDAGMRQLAETGWMHNRVRMIVASFLVKDLHLEWQHGARHFMQHLVDGDLASNQHGWQWVAGSGTDAAPYFRVFNPTTQGQKFDPDGDYIRRWVPELADLSGKEIHEPTDVEGYPDPIVDHKAERLEALRRLEKIKS